MSPTLRTLLTCAVPAVTALFGFIWLFSSKRSKQRHVEPPDKHKEPQILAEQEGDVEADLTPGRNASGEGVDNEKRELTPVKTLPVSRVRCLGTEAVVAQTAESLCYTDTTRKTEKSVQPKVVEEVVKDVQCSPVTAEPQVTIAEQITPQCVTEQMVEVAVERTDTDKDNNTEDQDGSTNSASLDLTEPEMIEEVMVAVEESVSMSKVIPVQSELTTASHSKADQSVAVPDSEEGLVTETVPAATGEQISESNGGSHLLVSDQDLAINGVQRDPSWSDQVANCDQTANTCLHDSSSSRSRSVSNGADSGQCSDSMCDTDSDTKTVCKNRDSPSSTKAPSHPVRNGEGLNNSDSSNCDNVSEASNDSGQGTSVSESTSLPTVDEEHSFEFNMPSDLCGLFIGSRGKTIKSIRDMSGARIRLKNNPYTPEFQICVIDGTQSAIDKSLQIIRKKFPSIKYPGMDLTPISPMTGTNQPVLMPEIMQLGLPEGVSVDVVVSSIVDAGRVFVQQPTHPTFPSLERLNQFMNSCYMQNGGGVPDIPRPIESGVICAAPMLNGWYRAQIMAVHEDTQECDIKYVDYGGYSRIASSLLKQIRSDFMTLPFEAVECYLANITPLQDERYFSPEAAAVLEELTQGKLLQAQVVGRSDDGIPYVHIYQISGNMSALMVNRELVNQGVARWIEILS